MGPLIVGGGGGPHVTCQFEKRLYGPVRLSISRSCHVTMSHVTKPPNAPCHCVNSRCLGPFDCGAS